MTTVITHGTFDLFHIGHVNILERARALGMDGVMLIWPLYDQDFSAFTAELKKRNLRVLYYIHGGGYPKRPYADDPTKSLQNMIDAGVEYVTARRMFHATSFAELPTKDIRG